VEALHLVCGARRPQLKRNPLGGNQEISEVKASVFVGTSLDGFIARPNGALDFLDAGGNEPHGYDEFMATVDALVIGRHTFDTVLGFGGWAYGRKKVFVLSTRSLPQLPAGAVVERLPGEPLAIVAQLEARGIQHVCRWRHHNSAFPASRVDSADHYHTRACVDRGRDTFVRSTAARHPATAYRDT
jgi:hypothetical protein